MAVLINDRQPERDEGETDCMCHCFWGFFNWIYCGLLATWLIEINGWDLV